MVDRRTLLSMGAGAATVAAVGGFRGLAQRPGRPRWEALRRELRGQLVLPSEAPYDQARVMALGQYDAVSPRGIGYCVSSRDVGACLRFAQDHGLPVAIRSGGHNLAGWSTSTGLVVDVSRMNHVRPGRDTVRLGPGAQAVDVVEALRPRDVQVVSGLCPTVASGGYLLGGGIGWQTRKFGLGSDQLVAAEVVLANGRAVICSAEHEPDLFWALRGGGGGNFGVVTDLKVRSTTVPRMVNFNLTWDWADVEDVLTGYTRWIPDGPDAWGSSLAVVLPDATDDAVPIVTILGGFLGPPERFEQALDGLVASVGRPLLTRAVQDLPYHQAMRQLYGCDELTVEQCHLVGYNPEALLPRYHFAVDRGRFADRPLSRRGAGQLIDAFNTDRRAGQFRYLTFFAMGGQANRMDAGATAYPHRSVEYYIGFTVGLNVDTPDPEDREAAQAWADHGFAVSDRHGSGGNYVNFPDPHLGDWRRAYYGQNYDRLARVKRRYDPHHFFRFPQSIGR